MQPITMTQTLGEPGALAGEAELRRRLDALAVALDGRPLAHEIKRVTQAQVHPDQLGGWLRRLDAVLAESFAQTAALEHQRRERLAEIDNQRIAILTASHSQG